MDILQAPSLYIDALQLVQIRYIYIFNICTTTQCKLQSTSHAIIYTPSLASIFLQYIGRYYIYMSLILLSRYNQMSHSAKSLEVCPHILDQHVLESLLLCTAPPVNKGPILMSSSCSDHLVTLVTRHKLSNHAPPN